MLALEGSWGEHPGARAGTHAPLYSLNRHASWWKMPGVGPGSTGPNLPTYIGR